MTETEEAKTTDTKSDAWGYLFKEDGKAGTDTLNRFLAGVANCISTTFNPSECEDLLPNQLAAFYRQVGGDYDSLFYDSPAQVAFIYRSLGCLHSLQPGTEGDPHASPKIPALKTQGFITWQTIQLLLCPEDHVPYMQKAVSKFEVLDPKNNDPFPKDLPASAFPSKPNDEMVAWFNQVSDKLRKEAEASATAEDQRPYPSPYRNHHLRPEGYDSRNHTPRETPRETPRSTPITSPRYDRAEYFSNPFPRDRDRDREREREQAARPRIIRRFSRDPRTGAPRSPRDYIEEGGRVVAKKVRRFWGPSAKQKTTHHRRPSLPDRYSDETSVSSRSSSPEDGDRRFRRHSHSFDSGPIYEYDDEIEVELTPTSERAHYSESPFRPTFGPHGPPPAPAPPPAVPHSSNHRRPPTPDSVAESSDTVSPPPPRHHGQHIYQNLRHRRSDEPPASPREYYHTNNEPRIRRYTSDIRPQRPQSGSHSVPPHENSPSQTPNSSGSSVGGVGFAPSQAPLFATKVAAMQPPLSQNPNTTYHGSPPVGGYTSQPMAPPVRAQRGSMGIPPSAYSGRPWSPRDDPGLMRSGSLNREYRSRSRPSHERGRSWDRGAGQPPPPRDDPMAAGGSSSGSKTRQGVRYVSSAPQSAPAQGNGNAPLGLGVGMPGIPGVAPAGMMPQQGQVPMMGSPAPPGGAAGGGRRYPATAPLEGAWR